MIAQKLLSCLKEKISRFGIIEGMPPEPIAIIPSVGPVVGPVLIYSHGDELVCIIKGITHAHFSSHNETLTEEEHLTIIIETIVDFLENLVQDKILLWKTLDNRMNGWIILHTGEIPTLVKEREYYVWSGPYVSK